MYGGLSITYTPEQLLRAQINGRNKKRSVGLTDVRQLVVAALTKGPMLLHELCEATGRSYTTLAVTLNSMESIKQIVVIGTAGQLSRKVKCRHDARVWALPGTPKLPPLPGASEKPLTSYQEKVYPTHYAPEFKPLRRNPYEHAELAMLTRRA